MKHWKKISKSSLAGILIALTILLSACSAETTVDSESEAGQQTSTLETEQPESNDDPSNVSQEAQSTISLDNIPSYSGTAYVEIHNNQPVFSQEELQAAKSSYETYTHLDSLGRCGVCTASIGTDIMPSEKRGAIGSVKPTGWHTVKYDTIADRYLYNRCHLIGYQLTGENANVNNLITGTRYLNVEGMLPFENMVSDYVQQTNHHVLYRVTPIFQGDNLVASGVLMEAQSVEDQGSGISFFVYCYNVQPGIGIDYATGDSWQENTVQTQGDNQIQDTTTSEYILNTNTRKFHRPSCYHIKTIKEDNKESYTGSRDDLINQGYEPCKTCNP